MNLDSANYKVEAGEGLRRTLHVQVPAAVMQDEFRVRLAALGRRTRIRGFRPGKAPIKLIRQRYGRDLWDELVRETIERSLSSGARRCSLRAAGSAEIKTGKVGEGSDLKYEATIDVLPDIEWKGLDELTYEEPAVEIRPIDVDRTIERLRRQGAEWKDVERLPRDGDRMVVNIRASRRRETLADGKIEEMPLVLGETRLMPLLKERLMQLSVSQKKKFRLRMPPSYPDEKLRGKRVLYEVQATSLSEPRLPELDEAFVRKLGVESGSVEELRSGVQANLERELQSACESHKRRTLFGQLLAANDGDSPESLVGREVERMLADMRPPPSSGGQRQEENGEGEEETPQEREMPQETPAIRAAAQRRVRMQLLVAELASREQIEVEDSLVRKRVQDLAAGTPDPEAALELFAENPDMVGALRTGIREELVLSWLHAHADVSRCEMSFHEFIEPMPPILTGHAR